MYTAIQNPDCFFQLFWDCIFAVSTRSDSTELALPARFDKQQNRGFICVIGTGLEDSDDDMQPDFKEDPDAEAHEKTTNSLPIKKERKTRPPEVRLHPLVSNFFPLPDSVAPMRTRLPVG